MRLFLPFAIALICLASQTTGIPFGGIMCTKDLNCKGLKHPVRLFDGCNPCLCYPKRDGPRCRTTVSCPSPRNEEDKKFCEIMRRKNEANLKRARGHGQWEYMSYMYIICACLYTLCSEEIKDWRWAKDGFRLRMKSKLKQGSLNDVFPTMVILYRVMSLQLLVYGTL